MAVVAPSTSNSSTHFSISSLISRFRSRRKQTANGSRRLPRDTRPPLRPSPLPLILPEHQQTLCQLGWTPVTFPQPQSTSGPEESTPGAHPLQAAYEDLFQASQKFFDLPDTEKTRWKHRLGSEEGWSKIPGEKEFITLRTLSYMPDILKGPAKRYWDLMGSYLDTSLGRISTSLNLPDSEDHGIRRFVGPCKNLGEKEEEKTATMLRLFRYEGWEEKVVAEPHADLGLLSIVVGNVPGLEVWNGREFVGIEKEYTSPSATLLGGRQLERFTNFRYLAGGHRVVSYGIPANTKPADSHINPSFSPTTETRYRFSIVFVLRAHEPVLVDSDELETDITGKWAESMKGITAGTMYEQIRDAHFNINIGHEERDRQRRRVAERDKAKRQGTNARGLGELRHAT